SDRCSWPIQLSLTRGYHRPSHPETGSIGRDLRQCPGEGASDRQVAGRTRMESVAANQIGFGSVTLGGEPEGMEVDDDRTCPCCRLGDGRIVSIHHLVQ